MGRGKTKSNKPKSNKRTARRTVTSHSLSPSDCDMDMPAAVKAALRASSQQRAEKLEAENVQLERANAEMKRVIARYRVEACDLQKLAQKLAHDDNMHARTSGRYAQVEDTVCLAKGAHKLAQGRVVAKGSNGRLCVLTKVSGALVWAKQRDVGVQECTCCEKRARFEEALEAADADHHHHDI